MRTPHFFHGALNTKMDRRGFESVEAMNEYMLRQWNRKVRKNDEVVILGDLSWGKAEETNELLERLNGRLYLIQGNTTGFLKNKDYNAGRFVWIKPYEELQDNKRKVILCHYPIMCYNGQYRVDEKGILKYTCFTAMCMIRRISGSWSGFRRSQGKLPR